MSRLKTLELGLDQFVKILVVPVLMKISLGEITGDKVVYHAQDTFIMKIRNNLHYWKNKQSSVLDSFVA